MMFPRPLLDAVLSAIALVGCADTSPVEALVDGGVAALAGDGCATPRVETWVGTASRIADVYPDDVDATVTWQRVATSGCVDSYVPSGSAHYGFAVPGAQCGQATAPAEVAIAPIQGTLTIDRSTAPATYVGAATTAWPVTWTCTYADGTSDTRTFDGGGVWFAATGTIDGDLLAGGRLQPDGLQCGQGQSSLPCTYAWSFVATP